MTNGKMENTFWKKLQTEPSMIKYESNGNGSNVMPLLSDTTNLTSTSSSSTGATAVAAAAAAAAGSIASSFDPSTLNLINQNNNLNDLTKLHNLISAVAATNGTTTSNETTGSSSSSSYDTQRNQAQHHNHNQQTSASSSSPTVEIGIVEKVLQGYGFIKCFHRDQLLFFNYPYYYQGPVNALKAGDFVEFEPVLDKRSGKTIASNVIKHQDKQRQHILQQQLQNQPQIPSNYSNDSYSRNNNANFSSQQQSSSHSRSSNVTFGLDQQQHQHQHQQQQTRNYSTESNSSTSSHGNMTNSGEGRERDNGNQASINLMNLKDMILKNNQNNSQHANTNGNNNGNRSNRSSHHSQSPSQSQSNITTIHIKNSSNSGGNSKSDMDETTNGNANDQQHLTQQQHNYQHLMHDLNMFKIQQHQQQQQQQENEAANAAMNINSILDIFNKENQKHQQQQQQQHGLNSNGSNKQQQQQQHQQLNGGMNGANGHKLSIPVINTKNVSNNIIELVSNEIIEGYVAIASKLNSPMDINFLTLDGRINYQRNGETFYIPYSINDLVPNNEPLKLGDKVCFQVAQDTQTGINYACQVKSLPAASSLSSSSSSDLQQKLQQQQQQRQKQLLQAPKVTCRGIISVLKDSFGKIEREDVYKETFFHFTEYRGLNAAKELKLGLNVEFEIEDRYGKEMATNIRPLPDGTINFDELSPQIYIGRIIQAPVRIPNSPMIGRLIYETDEKLVELAFGDGDRAGGDYTILEGDFVHFRIARDKRVRYSKSNQQRATQLTLIEEYPIRDNCMNTNEYREMGLLVDVINASGSVNTNALHDMASVKFKFGAVRLLEREDLIYFPFTEIIHYVKFEPCGTNDVSVSVKKVDLEVGDSVELSVVHCVKDSLFKNALMGIRVVKLEKNTIQFEMISEEVYVGVVEKEPLLGANENENANGFIRFDNAGTDMSLPFNYKSQCEDESGDKLDKQEAKQQATTGKPTPTVYYNGDKVQFNILTCLKTNKRYAVNVKIVEQRKEMGFITMLKDNYGFIELDMLNNAMPPTSNKLPKDIFFHYSSISQASANNIEIGDLVEFSINRKLKQKLSADNVTKIPNKYLKKFIKNVSGPTYKGKVIQTLRSHTTNASGQDQSNETYYGKVQLINSDNSEKDGSPEVFYYFGLFSLADKKSNLQLGDLVTFQLIDCRDQTQKAYNVQLQNPSQDSSQSSSGNQPAAAKSSRDHKKGKIESLKGHSGYIEYSAGNDSKKLFFHVSDLIDTTGNDAQNLKIGDDVEFVLSHGSRNGKQSATKIKRVQSSGANLQSSTSMPGEKVTNNNSASYNNFKTLTSGKGDSGSGLATNGGVGGSDASLNTNEEDNKRPERLNLKLKFANIDGESGKQLVLIRQPVNPDAKSKSFTKLLKERLPGSYNNNEK